MARRYEQHVMTSQNSMTKDAFSVLSWIVRQLYRAADRFWKAVPGQGTIDLESSITKLQAGSHTDEVSFGGRSQTLHAWTRWMSKMWPWRTCSVVNSWSICCTWGGRSWSEFWHELEANEVAEVRAWCGRVVEDLWWDVQQRVGQTLMAAESFYEYQPEQNCSSQFVILWELELGF